MITTILLAKILLLSFVITKFEPLQWLLEAIEPLFELNVFSKLIYKILMVASSCLKCVALYVGFILGGFWMGILASFIGFLYIQFLSYYVERPRLPKIDFE